MVILSVLASGSGSRMNADLPKQYLSICGRPIVVRTLDVFVRSGLIDKYIVAVSEDYFDFAKKLFAEFFEELDIQLVKGGKERHSTLKNILHSLNENDLIKDENILLTHDAVRPFIDERIIRENIEAALEYGACNTVINTVDTIIESDDGEFSGTVLDRSKLFNVQTPQTFKLNRLFDLANSLSTAETEKITDACSVFTLKKERVKLVLGRPENIKITYPHDCLYAETIIKMNGLIN